MPWHKQTDTTFPSSSSDFFGDGCYGWFRVQASTIGGQRCTAPREVGGTNDITVSNRVNLVDPFPKSGHICMTNNPSNCCRCLRRLVVLYKDKKSLHFDPPSRPSCRTRSPLLSALIRILYLDTARFIELLYVRSPF